MSFTADTLSSVIGKIYEAAYDQSAWTEAVQSLRKAFNGSRACFARIGPDVGAHDTIATECDSYFVAKFVNEHAIGPNVLKEAVDAVPEQVVYSDHALVGGDKLRKSRFWNEWMAPQDMYGGLGCKLFTKGRSYWFVDVQRGRNQADFQSDDQAILQQIVPHLARANQLSEQFQLKTISSAFENLTFGAIVVSADARILATNNAAEAMLSEPATGLTSRSGVLATQDSSSTLTLHQLIADCCRLFAEIIPGTGGDCLIPSFSDENYLGIAASVGPLPSEGFLPGSSEPKAIVLLRTARPEFSVASAGQLRALFKLSPAEARLAAALAGGLSLKEAAQSNHITLKTARTYLEAIFRKTNSRQQSQLVALLRHVQPLVQTSR